MYKIKYTMFVPRISVHEGVVSSSYKLIPCVMNRSLNETQVHNLNSDIEMIRTMELYKLLGIPYLERSHELNIKVDVDTKSYYADIYYMVMRVELI